MPGPSFIAHEWRGTTGNTIVRLIRGGAFAEPIGVDGDTGWVKNSGSTTPARSSGGTVARYKGLLYSASWGGISRLNPITGVWGTLYAWLQARHTQVPQAMLVVDTPTESYLVTVYTPTTDQRPIYVRYDGTTWLETVASAGSGIPQSMRMIYYKGTIHSYLSDTSGSMQTFNPVSQSFGVSTLPGIVTAHGNGAFFIIDDRLFVVSYEDGAPGTDTRAYEFTAGAWVDTGLSLTAGGNQGVASALVVNNEAFVFTGDVVTDALVCWKFSVLTPGGALQFSAITAPVPPSLRAGTSIGTPLNYRCYPFADTVSVPGSVAHYLFFFPDGTTGAVSTLFRWVDDSTEMTVAASPQVSGSSTPWHGACIFGGGEYLNGLGSIAAPLVTTSPRGATVGTSGSKITYKAYGDFLRIPHGAVTGGFVKGELATQAPSGATGIIVASSANETWLTNGNTGAWTNTEAFSTSSGSATQAGAAAGGAADKDVTIRYYLGPGSTGLGAPVTGLCSLVPGSAIGGGTVVIDGGGAGVDQVQGVVADGSEHSVEWDFFSDGVPEGLVDNVQLFIQRP